MSGPWTRTTASTRCRRACCSMQTPAARSPHGHGCPAPTRTCARSARRPHRPPRR
jgi:hypothetical protein